VLIADGHPDAAAPPPQLWAH